MSYWGCCQTEGNMLSVASMAKCEELWQKQAEVDRGLNLVFLAYNESL